MKVFQFFFNPKLDESLIFDSFCFEPTNIYEKRLGFLYMVGVLKNALPKNRNFLERISKFTKEKFYQKTLFKPERALKEALKETNQFLSEIAKEGDVSWLGNLSLAVLNFKDFVLNFTKVGEMKVYLIRGKKIIDIDKRLRVQEIEPYPLKIFGNIVTGKLTEGDLLLVLTKEIFEFFQSENLILKIKEVYPTEEKDFRKIFEEKKEKLKNLKGVFFAIFLTKEVKKGKKEIVSQKDFEEFSFSKMISSFFSPLSRVEKKDFQFNLIFNLKRKFRGFLIKRELLLILIFVAILFLGYFLFH
jgi:hypothetical protein